MPNSGLGVTPGSGVNLAVNQVAGLDYEVMKLDLGADGVSSPAMVDGSGNLKIALAASTATVTVNNPTAANLKVDASGATVPISAASSIPVSAPPNTPVAVQLSDGSASLSTLPVSGNVTAAQGTPASASAPWPIEITDGANGVVAVSTVSGQKCLDVNVLQTVGIGSQVDKSTFTEGTGLFEVSGGEYNTSPTLPASGQAAAVQITQYRALHSNLRDHTGAELGIAANPVIVQPSGSGTQPVSGTVTATLSGTTNAGATAVTADYDTGSGSQTMAILGIALPASGGAVAGGTSTNPVRVDPTGTTDQPINVDKVGGNAVSTAAAGVQKIGVADGSGGGIVNANPLVVTRRGLGETRVTNAVGMTASQTVSAIWTPASGKAFHLRKATLTITVTGTLKIFDGSNAAANMVYQGTPSVGPFELLFDEPFGSVANNNVLSYTSGSGLTGDIVTQGWEQ